MQVLHPPKGHACVYKDFSVFFMCGSHVECHLFHYSWEACKGRSIGELVRPGGSMYNALSP